MHRRSPEWTEFRHYPITSAIWVLSAIITFAWWGHYNVDALFETDAIAKGQLWRPITSTFLHVNILHLLFNLFWWWRLGTALEVGLGKTRFILMFILLAIGSGAAQFAWAGGGVGLSGVIYGLAAFLYVARSDLRFAGVVDQRTIGYLAIWFVFCVIMTINGSMPVGNMAHGSGAILGAMLGYCVVGRPRRLFVTATVCLVILSLCAATIAYPWFFFGGDPGEREAMLGYNALIHNRDQSAAKWLRVATERDPQKSWNCYNYGVALHRLGRIDEARDAYTHAKELAPGDKDIAQILADLPASSAPSEK